MSRCKYCGREIVWAVNAKTGNKLPLDLNAHIYSVYTLDPNPKAHRLEDAGHNTHGVSHFQTCPEFVKFPKQLLKDGKASPDQAEEAPA